MSSNRSALGTLFAIVLGSATSATAQVIVTLSGDVYDGQIGPLTNGVYHCQNVRVPAGQRLTLSNVNLKFHDNRALTVDGIVDASQGAFLTSIHDDSIGGDTNGNGGATVPQAGDWVGVRFSSSATGSSILNASIRYAGRGGSAALAINSPTVELSMTNAVIGNSGGNGADLGNSRPIFNNLLVADCAGVAMTGAFVMLDRVVNSTAWNCAGGNYIRRLTAPGGGPQWPLNAPASITFGPQHTLGGSGVMVIDGVINIPAGNQATLSLGLDCKLTSNGGFLVRGGLAAQGTGSDAAIFTSLFDDSVGGDTNLDGNATSPAPGDWRSIRCDAATGHLQFTDAEVRHAGGSFSFGGAVLVGTGRCDALRTTIRDSLGFGIGFGVTSPTSTNHSMVRDCAFVDLTDFGLHDAPLDDLPGHFGNTATGTTPAATSIVSLLRRDTTVSRDNLIHGLGRAAGTFSVPGGRSLRVLGGTAWKFPSNAGVSTLTGDVQVLGTPDAPVVMTSTHDDTVGGDTNGNGNATTPAAQDWRGIALNSSSTGRIEHADIRYAETGLRITSDQSRMRAVRALRCRDGFSITDHLGPIDNALAAECARDGIVLGNFNEDLRHASVGNCAGRGIADSGFAGTVRNSISWNNGGGNFTGLTAAEVFDSCGDFAGQNGNLAVDPQFADPATLMLLTSSPCVDAADTTIASQVATDVIGGSRVCAWDFAPIARADMGAYELAGCRLVTANPLPRVGDTVTFDIVPDLAANHGAALFGAGIGHGSGIAFLQPFGVLNAGWPQLVLIGAGPSTASAQLALPADPSFTGLELSVQGLLLPNPTPGRGNFTNVSRLRLLGL